MKKVKEILQYLFEKRLISLLILMMICITGFSQNVGMSPTGATQPNVAAGLDINFPTKGLLISRVALTSTTLASPLTAHVAGMMVYNTATAGDVIPGLYYNTGAKWVSTLPPAGTSNGDMQYWNGTAWVLIPTGLPGQKLVISALGVPTWSN